MAKNWRRSASRVLLALALFAGLAIVTVSRADVASASVCSVPYDCTDPAAGCNSSTTYPRSATLYSGMYPIFTVVLAYASPPSCRTIWAEYSYNVAGYQTTYQWVNRATGPAGVSWGLSIHRPTGDCDVQSWSNQLADAGYTGRAWAAVNSVSSICVSPNITGATYTYTATW